MTVTPQPPIGKGRGAWTAYGGLLLGGGWYYRLAQTGTTEQQVGSAYASRMDSSDSARAVNRGAAACQRLSGLTGSAVDGWFGPQTDKAVRAAQTKAGVFSDGIVGQVTMRAWLTPLITATAKVQGVPVAYLGGIAMTESNLDPGAVGYDTPNDKGLVQINLSAHPEVSYDQAFDEQFSIAFAASSLRKVHDAWVASSRVDAWKVAILWHNSPENAVKLALTGDYPSAQARQYVTDVLSAW